MARRCCHRCRSNLCLSYTNEIWQAGVMPPARAPRRQPTIGKVTRPARNGASLRDFSDLKRVSGGNSLLGHCGFEILADRLEELLSGHPSLLGANKQRKVLGHLASFDGLDANALQRFGEAHDFRRLVELAAELQAASPGEDRRDRVGRGRLALLVLA